MRVLGKIEGVVDPGQGSLEIAQDGVAGLELRQFGTGSKFNPLVRVPLRITNLL